MRYGILLLITILFAACSTQQARLDKFIDKDIQEVIDTYGHPVVAFPVDEKRRDFQWVMSSEHVPSYSISESALLAPEMQNRPNGVNTTITPKFNNKPIMTECLYTLKTRWDSVAEDWIVTGYQKPVPGC